MQQKLNTKDLVPANGGGHPVAVWKMEVVKMWWLSYKAARSPQSNRS